MPVKTALLCAGVALASPLWAAQQSDTAPIEAAHAGSGEAATSNLSYTRFADLVVAAPTIVDAVIHDVIPLKGEQAAGIKPGFARVYIEADVSALIRSPGALPPTVGYIADVPLDSHGRVPKLRKSRVLLFARPAREAGQIQLVSADGQRPWSPEADALTRRITTDLVAAGAPPAITGVGHAFHTPGALPGEGETQIFLLTADGSPISLTIVRKQGEPPRWSPSIGDLADPNAAPPAHDTLLWYRLACELPASIPDSSLDGIYPADAAAAREDYKVVLNSLGGCGH